MRILRGRSVLAALLVATAGAADAQWVTQHEQTYLPARHNWEFRHWYPAADRLFNAFDYGHAILYETLYRKPGASASLLEEKEFEHLTRRVLARPPRVPLEEGAIEVAYAKIAPEAKLMFEWAHVLHRQVYDVWADERLAPAQKDAAVAELLRYYKSRPDLAFSSRPKSMTLMEGQPYSLAFRKKYPKFNGLIWAYHWMQVGLYDALLEGKDAHERQANVSAAVTRFWQMLEGAPANMPRLMPMTAAIAPRFAARYPEAAIIFDNLHGLHDVISDVLASPLVSHEGKRSAILAAARAYRDDTTEIMTVAEWREMAAMMGVQNMGGVAVGFLPDLPTPTVPLGASHSDAMGHAHDAPAAKQPAPVAKPDPHAGHEMPAKPSEVAKDTSHAAHGVAPPKPAAKAATTKPKTSTSVNKPAPKTSKPPAKKPTPAKKADPHAGHRVP